MNFFIAKLNQYGSVLSCMEQNLELIFLFILNEEPLSLHVSMHLSSKLPIEMSTYSLLRRPHFIVSGIIVFSPSPLAHNYLVASLFLFIVALLFLFAHHQPPLKPTLLLLIVLPQSTFPSKSSKFFLLH